MSTDTMKSSAPRTAVITGAALGLGQEYARRLAADGIRIVAADIADTKDTVDLVTGEGSEGIGVHCDVSSEESIEELRRVVEDFGGADILVHNAGIYPIEPIEEISLSSWRRVQSVNVEGLFLLVRAFLPSMRERGWGRIVGVSSGVFAAGGGGAVHYVASKGAIVGFVRGLAPDVAGDGITVNAIAPGLVRTPGTLAGPHTEIGMFDAVLAAQDIKHVGEPGDISGTLAFLVSDGSAFMTGQTLIVDGGVARS